jgi:Flp pilus assembly protein TadD/TolB-like protein
MKKILVLSILTLAYGDLRAASHTRTVLVFPFTNLSARSDLGWISESFAVGLSSRLAGPERYVLGRRERDAAYDQLGLPGGVPLTLASMYKVAEGLGAEWAVLGSFNMEGDRLIARAGLLDVPGMKLWSPIEVSGDLADLLDLQTDLAWRLLSTRDPDFTTGKEEDFRRQFPEIHLDAFENYVRGILATDASSRVRFLAEADRRDPKDHRAAFELGRFYFDGKDYSKAAGWLRKLEPAESNYLESVFLLGVSEYFLGNDSAAERDFAELSKQIPLSEVYNNLGVIQFHRGRPREALASFDRALTGDPANPVVQFNRAACLGSLERYEEAVKVLDEYLRVEGDDAEAHTLLAAVLGRLGDSVGKRQEIHWLVEHEGSSLEQAEVLANTFLPQPRLKKNYSGRAFGLLALTLRNQMEQTLSHEPPAQHAQAHRVRGRTFLADDRLPEAERELAEAVALEPQSSEGHLLLAQAYEAEGKHREAAAELEASLKLKDTAAAHLWLGRIYLAANRLEAARIEGQAALEREPGSADCGRLMEQIRERAGASKGQP